MRIVVTGGRDFQNADFVDYVLGVILGAHHGDKWLIHHGGAQGLDSLVHQWALDNGVAVVTYRANWREFGRAAGAIRNSIMIEEAKPDIVVAFPGGKGTQHAIDFAKKKGHRVLIFTDTDVSDYEKSLRHASKVLNHALDNFKVELQKSLVTSILFNAFLKVTSLFGIKYATGGVIKPKNRK